MPNSSSFSSPPLEVYSSIASLTNRIVDYSNVIVLPIICVLGMLANSAIILVAAEASSRRILFFKYMLIAAIADLLFLLSQFPLFLIRCGLLCPLGYSFAAKFYEIYVYWFVGYTIVTFQLLLNISISIDRLFIFFKVEVHAQHWSRKFYFRCGLFLLVSVVLNVPAYILSVEVKPFGILVSNMNMTTNEDALSGVHNKVDKILYGKSIRDEFKSAFWTHALTVLSVLKEPVLICALCLISSVVVVVFRHHTSEQFRKGKIKNSKLPTGLVAPTSTSTSKSPANSKIQTCNHNHQTQPHHNHNHHHHHHGELKLTLMTIVICLAYFLGNAMDCFLIIVDQFSNLNFDVDGYMTIVCNILLFVSHDCNLLIYLCFNRQFRQSFLNKLNGLFMSISSIEVANFVRRKYIV